jgi:hypothetical protein
MATENARSTNKPYRKVAAVLPRLMEISLTEIFLFCVYEPCTRLLNICFLIVLGSVGPEPLTWVVNSSCANSLPMHQVLVLPGWRALSTQPQTLQAQGEGGVEHLAAVL